MIIAHGIGMLGVILKSTILSSRQLEIYVCQSECGQNFKELKLLGDCYKRIFQSDCAYSLVIEDSKFGVPPKILILFFQVKANGILILEYHYWFQMEVISLITCPKYCM